MRPLGQILQGPVQPEQARAWYGDQARTDLIEKLIEGKNVHRCNERDIFDCAINAEGQQGIHGILDLLAGVLALNDKGGDDFQLAARALADDARGFVERFVDAHPDWIQERAEEMAEEADADAGSEDHELDYVD